MVSRQCSRAAVEVVAEMICFTRDNIRDGFHVLSVQSSWDIKKRKLRNQFGTADVIKQENWIHFDTLFKKQVR